MQKQSNEGILNSFSEKRNSALRKKTFFELILAYVMFGVMNHPLISQFFLKLMSWLLKMKIPGVKWLLRQTLYQQFCGGQTPNECLPVIKKNHPEGVYAILDYSVEGQNNQKSWDLLFEELKTNLKRAENNPAIPFCILK